MLLRYKLNWRMTGRWASGNSFPYPGFLKVSLKQRDCKSRKRVEEGHFGFLSSSLNEGKCYFVAKPLPGGSPSWGFTVRSPQEGNPEPDIYVPAPVHPFPSLPGKFCVAAPLVLTISILMGLLSSLALVLLRAELIPLLLTLVRLGTNPTRAGTGDLSCKLQDSMVLQDTWKLQK